MVLVFLLAGRSVALGVAAEGRLVPGRGLDPTAARNLAALAAEPGRTQVFVAVAPGSVPFWVPLLSVSANALIVSPPGSAEL